jgi:hypothetical protein
VELVTRDFVFSLTVHSCRESHAPPLWPDTAGSSALTIAVHGHSVQDRAVKRHTTASCFAIYLLPHVLFVAEFEERQRIAKVCCLAWNIGLFPDAAERERQTEQVLDLVLADVTGTAPPGFRDGFADELRMLVEIKRDLFPWRFENVMEADLKQTPRGDVLVVDNGKAVERIDLSRRPSIAGLPIITKALVQMHRDTQAQRHTLEQARATPGLVEQVATPDMVTAYCAQRADLRGYHRMLTAWREETSLPEMKAGIDRFLQAINAIEEDSKAVLGILVAALDAAARA